MKLLITNEIVLKEMKRNKNFVFALYNWIKECKFKSRTKSNENLKLENALMTKCILKLFECICLKKLISIECFVNICANMTNRLVKITSSDNRIILSKSPLRTTFNTNRPVNSDPNNT
ncbi:hypothetical protein BpHYR1_015823 [Brachionus plicatilis]|uniref:Uncharacterized protein n=1 Tax=Brachionus plicatilis TaxID=10195 RepID=A0A3M7SNW6_BRAPC|nr:hypothetical protein BpHYR1_015823 [Brachionus plicatilis]